MLTREQILQAKDLRREEVKVPEWGGSVLVCTMTGTQKDAWEMSIVTADFKPNPKQMRAKLVAATVVDEGGKPLFTEQDLEALSEKSASALDRIVAVAQRLNAVTKKDLDELAKNS